MCLGMNVHHNWANRIHITDLFFVVVVDNITLTWHRSASIYTWNYRHGQRIYDSLIFKLKFIFFYHLFIGRHFIHFCLSVNSFEVIWCMFPMRLSWTILQSTCTNILWDFRLSNIIKMKFFKVHLNELCLPNFLKRPNLLKFVLLFFFY